MKWFTRTLVDPFADCETLRRGRYGVIETHEGRLESIRLRSWPKVATALEASWSGRRCHRGRPGDRCWLYYNQPRSFPNFLALKYLVSTRRTTMATIHTALAVLDEIARLKRADSLLCDVTNLRISDRIMARHGWEPHKPQRWHRNFI